MKNRVRKVVLFSVLVALLVHAALLGVLSLRQPPPVAAPAPAMAVALTQVEQPAAPGDSPRIDEGELARKFDTAVRRMQSFSLEQNLKTLRDNTRWLESHSSEQAVSEISAVVRRATGAPNDNRAYAPVDNPPPGEFDHASMLPYATAKVTGDDGLERTERTLIDKAGRTMKQTVRRAPAADGVPRYFHGVYLPDGQFFEYESDEDPFARVGTVLETVSQSPLLQQLFRQAVLPALEAKRKTAPSQP